MTDKRPGGHAQLNPRKEAKRQRTAVKAQVARQQGSRDLQLRTKHLFNAALWLEKLDADFSQGDKGNDAQRGQKRKSFRGRSATHGHLARRFVHDIRGVARKGQLKIAVPIKRRLCKRCDTLLIEGRTVDVKYSENMMTLTCQRCSTPKCFPLKNGPVDIVPLDDFPSDHLTTHTHEAEHSSNDNTNDLS
ncbi:hypothetical protein PYCC9005_000354 [Savitreella phatthalungensis]